VSRGSRNNVITTFGRWVDNQEGKIGFPARFIDKSLREIIVEQEEPTSRLYQEIKGDSQYG
jgi:hypothetical protein